MNADVTDAPVDGGDPRIDRRTIDLLWSRRLISPEARAHALELVDPPRQWGVWAARILTVFGVALMLSGIVYFFAFNWERIPPLAKLAGIGGLIAVAAMAPLAVGFESMVGRVGTTIATVLVGVFLAVFGQIYQTGADAWGLFFGWALLTLPWALLATSSATWAVWLVVADVAIILWWGQTRPEGYDIQSGSSLSIIMFNGFFLILREVLATRGVGWVAGRWTRFLLLVPILGMASVAAFGWIFDHWHVNALERSSAAVGVAAIVGCLVVYRRVLPDVPALALAVMAACVVVVMAVFELMYRAAPRADVGVFFLNGLFTIALFAAAVAWLRRASRELEARHD